MTAAAVAVVVAAEAAAAVEVVRMGAPRPHRRMRRVGCWQL